MGHEEARKGSSKAKQQAPMRRKKDSKLGTWEGSPSIELRVMTGGGSYS